MMARLVALGLLGLAFTVSSAAAQPLGTFRWQLQPYCNVLTVNVTQQAGIYTLDGTDDRCGAAQAASALGTAFLNPSGLVGFGLTVVLPNGAPVHIEATIDISSLSGTWRDSGAHSGTFVFTPGAGTGGPPRPVPAGGVAPGSITSIHIAPGAVSGSQIAPNSITGAQIANASLTRADLADAPVTDAAVEFPSVILTAADEPVMSVTIVAPAAGRIIANASGSFLMDPNGMTLDTGRCSITTGLTVLADRQAFARENSASSYRGIPWGLTRAFTVTAGSSTTIRLVCDAFSGQVTLSSPSLNAFFVAGS